MITGLLDIGLTREWAAASPARYSHPDCGMRYNKGLHTYHLRGQAAVMRPFIAQTASRGFLRQGDGLVLTAEFGEAQRTDTHRPDLVGVLRGERGQCLLLARVLEQVVQGHAVLVAILVHTPPAELRMPSC